MSWLKNIAFKADVVRGRFECFEASSSADRQACVAILEEVRRHELNRVHGSGVLETAAFADRDVHDQLFATRDTKTGDIVGCMRRVDVMDLVDDETSRTEYNLDVVPPEVLQRSQAFTRFAVLPAYRKSAASLTMFLELYQRTLEDGGLASFQACEPGLYQPYLRLGFRPLGPVHVGASGGFRVPMVHVHHDREHLTRVKSPVLPRLRSWKGECPDTAVRWFRTLRAQRRSIDYGVAIFSADDAAATEYDAVTRGLSERGRKELFKNSMEVICVPGDLIMREGDGGRFLGLVSRGIVEVRSNGQTVAILGEGELFGEVAVALDGYRTADLIAASDDTRVIVLSRSCLRRLSRAEDRAEAWRNIARVLAERLKNSA